MPLIMPLLALILLAGLAGLAMGGLSLIIWLPTRTKDLARIMRLADLGSADIFYDLGCGDGRVAFYIAGKTGAQVTGLELAWPLYLFCLIRRSFSRRKNPVFRCSDLFKVDLSRADVVYVFGIPDKLASKLKPKLEQGLKPGSKVISYAFAIAGWTPAKIDRPTEQDIPIFLYVM